MKTSRYCLLTGLSLFIAALCASPALAGDEKLFLPEMERAVDRAIAAWQQEDGKALKAGLEKLTLQETYLLAVGASTKDRSYLANVPKGLNRNPNAVAAHLFLIRQERQGNPLLPRQVFEGRYYQFEEIP
jgi:hypothetical protein